jgi:hypothetical protein
MAAMTLLSHLDSLATAPLGLKFHMRILEIGEGPYVSVYAPGITDFFSTHKTTTPETRLTLRHILLLRQRLKAGYYDLVVYHIRAKTSAPWHRHHAAWRAALEILTWSFSSFYKISWHYFHYVLAGTTTPLVIIDTQDAPRITKTESYWLERSRFWFMRELPPNHMNLFLGMDRRCGDVVNIARHKRLARNFSKIRPFSLGFEIRETAGTARVQPHEKIHDVFYAGANHTTTVRQEGLPELKALQAAGVRVYIPETRLTRPDFFRACAQSWLVWSPEGQGWDCHRHYEALMLYSVPLINQPTIERVWPFLPGEHCLYYRTEPGGLTEAVTRALKDRNGLVKIAEQGRAHILQHHARGELVRHILSSVGLLEQAAPHVVNL